MANNVIQWGFHRLADLFATRIIDNDPVVIDTAITEFVSYHSRLATQMLGELVQPTTDFKVRKMLPGVAKLQPLTEDGIPKPQRAVTSYFENSYPLWRGGYSIGMNREVRAKMTVGELNDRLGMAQTADYQWLVQALMSAIFTNADWAYTDEEHGVLTIRTFAKTGDGSVFMNQTGTLAAFNHYLAQASAIDNSNNPYSTLYTLLSSHPGNRGPYVAWVPTNLVAATEALTAFYESVADLRNLINFGALENRAQDNLDQYLGFGTRVMGVANRMILIEAPALPDNYIVARATSDLPPVAMRQMPEAQLQGYQVENVRENSNFSRYDFYRIAGFAPQNPVSMAVMRVGNASYAIPTGYNAAEFKG